MRRNPPARWVLPEVIDPDLRLCIEMEVPNDPAHIAAFRGAMLSLASAYNWADDPDHKAKRVAAVWRDIIDSHLEWGCSVQTLIVFDELCGLQWSYDGGLTWETASFADCARYWAQHEIDDAITDGTLQRGGSQPGPSSPPLATECKTYHVQLNANNKWKVPFSLNTGDTVRITNPVGGWTDGALRWYCPTGKSYSLGVCGIDNPYLSGDPLQSGNHMQLIGAFNTTSPVYFNPLTALYTIPAGVTDAEAWIQPNDAPLSDNSGQVEFDVEICVGGWIHTFDFSISQQGWSAAAAGSAVYQNSRWEGVASGGNNLCDIRIAISKATILRTIRYVGSVAAVGGGGCRGPSTNQGAYCTEGPNSSGGFDHTMTFNISNPTYLMVNMDTQNATPLTYFNQIVVTGYGADPWV